MRSKFDQELSALHQKLDHMVWLIGNLIESAVEALINLDVEEAKRIKKADKEVNAVEKDIEKICLRLILLRQPVAGDLRKISTSLKMITDLERIGDHAADISEIIIRIAASEHTDIINEIPIKEMAREAVAMVKESISAYITSDAKLAKKVIKTDFNIDKYFDEVRAALIEQLNTRESPAEYCIDLMMIAKYFERVGDHATNIAEWVIFSATGKHQDTKIL